MMSILPLVNIWRCPHYHKTQQLIAKYIQELFGRTRLWFNIIISLYTYTGWTLVLLSNKINNCDQTNSKHTHVNYFLSVYKNVHDEKWHIYKGDEPIPINAAAKRPADSFHTSLVNAYVASAVRPLNSGAKNTHTSRIWTGMWSKVLRTKWMNPEVTINPG